MKELQAFTLKDPALGQWKDIPNTEILNKEGRLVGIKPRKIQIEIQEQLRDKRNTIINAPGGSGKSKAAQFLHAPALIKDPNKKLIIAVPKKIIQKGFGANDLHIPNETIISWDPINLCENSMEKKKELLDFLNKNKFPKGINERIMVTTHQALASLFAELVEQKLINKEIFHNTSIVIDEAHRLLNAEEEETGITISNGIGKLVKYALKCQEKDETIGMHLMTATAFRGDRYSLLSKKDFKKFSIFYLPIDKHWKDNIKYIEDYSYNYVVYNGNFWKEIETLIKRHKNENILFFLPRGSEKYKIAEKIKKIIQKHKPKVRFNLKICDLVEDRNGGERDKLKDDINENESDYDSVLTVDIFNEGADWPPCEVIIDLEPASGSLPKAIQRWLRAFRDKDYKKHLHYYSFLPFVLDTLDEEKYFKILNKNFAAFMLAMVIEDVVNPILIPRPKGNGKGKGGKREEKVDYLTETVKDIHKRIKIQTDVRADLIALKAQSDEEDKVLIIEDIEKSIKLTLKKNKVKKNVEEIALQIFVALKRNVSKYRGVDVSKLVEDGFGEVKKEEVADEIFKDILVFPAMISGKSFAELKEIWKKAYKSAGEWVKIAERLAEENNGILPNTKWLQKNGFWGLDACIRKYPKLFSHIKQKKLKKIRTIEEHIKYVKEKNIKDSGHWVKHWKENNLKDRNYIKGPWGMRKDRNIKKFFEEIWGKKKTKKEHMKYIKDKNIKNGAEWVKHWKENNLKEQGYFYEPWAIPEKD